MLLIVFNNTGCVKDKFPTIYYLHRITRLTPVASAPPHLQFMEIQHVLESITLPLGQRYASKTGWQRCAYRTRSRQVLPPRSSSGSRCPPRGTARTDRVSRSAESDRDCVKTRKKSASKKIDLSERVVFDFFESGNGRRTPEIEQNRIAHEFSHSLDPMPPFPLSESGPSWMVGGRNEIPDFATKAATVVLGTDQPFGRFRRKRSRAEFLAASCPNDRTTYCGNTGYSGSVSPDPPISLGISLILGSPSWIRRTVS